MHSDGLSALPRPPKVHYKEGGYRIYHNDGLRAKLQVSNRSVGVVDLWLDCMPFRDYVPEAAGHGGEHFSQICSTINHRTFESWVADCKERIEEIERTSQKNTVTIVLVCKQGINRSPACTKILAFVLDYLGC